MKHNRFVSPRSFGHLKQVSRALIVALRSCILLAVITVCAGLKQDLSSTCSNAECIDESVSSPSQLIQLLHITEPLVTGPGSVAPNSSAPAGGEVDRVLQETKIDTSSNWKWNYIDEQKPGFEVLIRENSFDERLSNLAFVSDNARLVNIDYYIIDSGDTKLDLEYGKKVKGSQVDDVQCELELQKMVSMLNELGELIENKRRFNNLSSYILEDRHIRLAYILDSYGRYQSGGLLGRAYFLGAYDQCVETQLQLDGKNEPDLRTSTRYCVAKLAIDKHLTGTLRKRSQRNPANVSLHVGICIPKSCHSDSFLKYKHLYEELLYSQFELPKSIFQEQKPELRSIFCFPDADSQYRRIPTSGRLLIVTLIVWFVLIGFFTYVGQQVEQRQQSDRNYHWMVHLRNSLNLKRSWQDFILENAHTNKINKIQLDTLNPIKVLGCVYVIWGHSLMTHLMSTMDIIKGYQKFESDLFMTVNLSGPLIVDTFFVITGILIAFMTTRRLRKNINVKKVSEENRIDEIRSHAKHSSYLIMTRYFRLVPLYFLIFWFKKSLLLFLGSGPIWDYGLNKATMDGSCQSESWTTPFTYLAAYKPLSRQCLPQAWSVANDLYFSIFLAPIIIIMAKRPKLATLISIVISISSGASMFRAIESADHDLKADASDLRCHAIAQFFGDYSVLYTAAHNRIFSLMIGTLAGCLLCHYEDNSIKQWPRLFKGAATKLSIGFMIFAFAGPTLIPVYRSEGLLKTYPVHQNLFAHINSTFRLLWCLSTAIICIRMTTDWKDNYLMQNCAGKFWKIAARLNYAILLIHTDVLSIQSHLTTIMPTYSKMAMFSLFASSLIISGCLSLIIHVCIENPIDKLINGCMDRLVTGTYTRESTLQMEQENKNPNEAPKKSATTTTTIKL